MRALGNMYMRYASQHHAGKIWLGIGLAGGLATLRVATAGSSNTSSNPYAPTAPSYNGSAIAIVGGIFGGIPLLIGISKLAAGSSLESQDSVVARYARNRPLPAGVVQRLRRKDFD